MSISATINQLSEQCRKLAEGLSVHAPQGTPTGTSDYLHKVHEMLQDCSKKVAEAEQYSPQGLKPKS